MMDDLVSILSDYLLYVLRLGLAAVLSIPFLFLALNQICGQSCDPTAFSVADIGTFGLPAAVSILIVFALTDSRYARRIAKMQALAIGVVAAWAIMTALGIVAAHTALTDWQALAVMVVLVGTAGFVWLRVGPRLLERML